jgi:hypothetical protein
MRKLRILLLFLLPAIVSCTTSPLEEFVVGKNFVKDQAGIIKIDTLTLQSSIVKYDSIISNSSGRFLIGSNYNAFSGYKRSSSFFTLKFDGSIDNTKFVYDSLCLVLSYDAYYDGDTTVTQTFKVHQLKEVMELNNSYLYTTSKFKYDPVPLGTKSFQPRPKSKVQLNIRLSDALGNKMAKMIKLKRDTITSQDSLVKKFIHGIMITSETNCNGAILGFRTADLSSSTSTSSSQKNKEQLKPEMRLYYHLSPNPNELKDLYYKFSFVTDGIYFNQISGDPTNTPMEGIEASKNEYSSKQTGNQTIIQSGIQTFTKFKIPFLDNLTKSYSNPAVVGAILRLYPVKGTYNKTSELPDSLYVYKADKKNSLMGQVTLPGQTDKYVLLKLGRDAYKKIITDDKDRIFYEVDISAFIEAELAEQLETTNSLFIGFGSTNSKKTAQHVILGGANSGKYSPALSVFYYHN